MNNALEFVKSRRFAPLFGTQFLGAFNDNLFKTTLFVLISFYGLGNNNWIPSNQLLNVGALLFVLPYFLFSALSGQLATRFNKARLAQMTKLLEIIIMLLASVGFYYASTPLLLFCLFLMGSQSALFGPIKYAILPEYLDNRELLMGNGLIESGTFIAILFGQILGTTLAGLGTDIIVFSILLVSGLGMMSSLFMPSSPVQDKNASINLNIISSTKTLLNETFKQKELLTAIIGISWFWFIGAVYTTQLPTFVQLHLGGNDQVFNLILTLFSIGIAAGSLTCAKLSRGQLQLFWVILGGVGLTIFGLLLVYYTVDRTFSPNYLTGIGSFLLQGFAYPIMFLMTAIGFVGGFFSVPLYTWLQTVTTDQFRAHAVAANNIINGLFMVGAAVFSGILLFMIDSISLLYLIVAIGNIPIILILMIRYPQFLSFKK